MNGNSSTVACNFAENLLLSKLPYPACIVTCGICARSVNSLEFSDIVYTNRKFDKLLTRNSVSVVGQSFICDLLHESEQQRFSNILISLISQDLSIDFNDDDCRFEYAALTKVTVAEKFKGSGIFNSNF